jgi:catechol 2,3-dioxygenase-like lactoylglutathione lyase family enzyme
MPLRISHTVTLLQVFDMPTSLRFYRDLLGFEVVQRSQPTDSCGWVWLRLGDVELMLNTAYEDADRPSQQDEGRRRAHGDTVLYFGCRDVDASFRYLRAIGIAASAPRTAPYGMRQTSFQDPDGYGLCLQWPADQSGAER